MMNRTKIIVLGLAALSMCSLVSRAGDGVVALQTADPSCPDDSGNTYVDCGNGTVTDNRTGLVWLQNANCLGGVDWHTAMEVVVGLSDLPGSDPDDCGLSDGSSPGEWRLPSVSEWEAMVADARNMSCVPTITNDAGNGCWNPTCLVFGACSFVDVQPSFYWSSTSLAEAPTVAWGVSLGNGFDLTLDKTDTTYVWPVRGGQ